ncbi:Cytochrome B Ascorbate-Dependent Protein 3 [Manis pentadactyla]|nr:Cytochrome B Ascorbate-Dependent Protein 3 [Manis pentadactyla]
MAATALSPAMQAYEVSPATNQNLLINSSTQFFNLNHNHKEKCLPFFPQASDLVHRAWLANQTPYRFLHFSISLKAGSLSIMRLTKVKPLAVWHSVFQGGETGQEVQGNLSHIADLFQNFTFWEGLWQFCLYDDDFSDYRTSVQSLWSHQCCTSNKRLRFPLLKIAVDPSDLEVAACWNHLIPIGYKANGLP